MQDASASCTVQFPEQIPLMLDLKPDKMALYKATAQKRAQQEEAKVQEHFARAQQVAQQAAILLKARFSVKRVALFGSLVHKALFHLHSDIDLAAWGLGESEYYRAVGELQALDPLFSIDLVRLEDAPPTLLTTITQEGVSL